MSVDNEFPEDIDVADDSYSSATTPSVMRQFVLPLFLVFVLLGGAALLLFLPTEELSNLEIPLKKLNLNAASLDNKALGEKAEKTKVAENADDKRVDASKLRKQTDYTKEQTERLLNTKYVVSSEMPDDLVKLQARLGTLDKKLSMLLKQQSENKKLISDNVKLLDMTQMKLGELSSAQSNINDQLGEVKTEISRTSSDSLGISRAIHSIEKQIKRQKKKKRNKVLGPPFKLVSIDRWGDTDTAVLEMSGRTTSAIVGDRKAGWKIKAIRKPGCISVVSSTKVEKEICVAG